MWRTVNISLVPMLLDSLLQKFHGAVGSGCGEYSLSVYSFKHLTYIGSISRPGNTNSSLHAVPLKVMWIHWFRGHNKLTVSLYGYIFFCKPHTIFSSWSGDCYKKPYKIWKPGEMREFLCRHDIWNWKFLTK